jgi:hypothetical protein
MPFGLDARLVFFLCLLAGIALMLLALYLKLRLRRRVRDAQLRAEAVGREKRVVLLASGEKIIESGIHGVFISLEKFFLDMGFSVIRTRSPKRLRRLFAQGAPVILAIDCRLGSRVLRKADAACADCPGLRTSVAFFYNAAHPESLKPPLGLPHASFLGQFFTSLHVLELVSYAISLDATAPRPEGTGREPCALEGKITAHALAEILQFLEVGRRTGMLSVEDGRPAGIIGFESGVITFAQTRSREGFEAVLEILSQASGTFHFFGDKRVRQSNCNLSSQEVMMHWAHRLDETWNAVASNTSNPGDAG